jgi:hypothetical protein
MIYRPEMLDILQSAAVSAWDGIVYRNSLVQAAKAKARS